MKNLVNSEGSTDTKKKIASKHVKEQITHSSHSNTQEHYMYYRGSLWSPCASVAVPYKVKQSRGKRAFLYWQGYFW